MMSDMMELIIVSLGATLLRNIQKEPEQDVLFVETIPTLSAPNVKFTCIASVLEHLMERIEFSKLIHGLFCYGPNYRPHNDVK